MKNLQTATKDANECIDGVVVAQTKTNGDKVLSGQDTSQQSLTRTHSRSNSQTHPSPMSITELCNSSPGDNDETLCETTASYCESTPPFPAPTTITSAGVDGGGDEDEFSKRDLDVQLAAQVLGDMRSMDMRRFSSLSNYRGSTASSNSSSSSCCSTPSSASLSTSPASTSPARLLAMPSFPSPLAPGPTTSVSNSTHCPASHQQPEPHHESSDHFITRVSSIPLVNSALKAYEQSKAHSKVVKYAAEGVENSVQKVWKPVVNRLEPRLGQLDEFACRQLDKLEQKFPAIMESPTNIYESSKRTMGDAVYRFLPNSAGDPRGRDFQGWQQQQLQQKQEQQPMSGGMIGADSQQEYEMAAELRRREVRQRSDYSEGIAHETYSESDSSSRPGTPNRLSQSSKSSFHGNAVSVAEQRQTRSRWQQVLVEAGAAAGAAGAAVSEESMRSLKYSLQWLQYASSHINHQISLLKSYLEHLAATASSTASNSTSVTVTASASSTLAAIKREVVETLRKVVEVVGRYAGAALPGEARRAVRSFILTLPSRWATLNAPSIEASPMFGPLMGAAPSGLSPAEAAHRVLTLATESLVMLKSVAGILGETVQRAEGWVERLRVMGVNAGGGAPGASALPIGGKYPPPTSAFGSGSTTSETSNQIGVMPVAGRRRPYNETLTPKTSAFMSSSSGSPLHPPIGLGLVNSSNGSHSTASMSEHRESFREYTDDESDLDTVLDGMKQSIVRSSSICSTASSCSEYSSTSSASIPAFSIHSSLRSETDSGVSIISSTSAAGLLVGADEDMGVKNCESELRDDHNRKYGGIALPSIQYLHPPHISHQHPTSLPQPHQPLHPQYQNPLDVHHFRQNGSNGNGNEDRRSHHHRLPSLPTIDSGFGAAEMIGMGDATPQKDPKSNGIIRMELE